MQNKSSSKATFLIMIAIIVIAVGAYFYFKGSPTDSSTSSLSSQSTPESSDAQAASGRVLSLLNQINSLKIDASIFESAVYKTLVDYTIDVPEQGVGRPNPFAPLPGSVPKSSALNLPSTAR